MMRHFCFSRLTTHQDVHEQVRGPVEAGRPIPLQGLPLARQLLKLPADHRELNLVLDCQQGLVGWLGLRLRSMYRKKERKGVNRSHKHRQVRPIQ
jgi:hypothetical protein